MDIVHDWPGQAVDEIPSPTLVAAWLALDTLSTEKVPRWAAFWLAGGHDGTALADLAGLHGDDPHDVRDLLPAALADCGAAAPTTASAAAMVAFTNLAQLFVAGKAHERWIVDKVNETVARSGYAESVIVLPLGRLYGMDDEWKADPELRAATRRACVDQLRLAAG